jgi:cysteine desulfurase
VPGVVGFAKALTVSLGELATERPRLLRLRNELWSGLQSALPGTFLNGPDTSNIDWRLPGNLNLGFPGIDGQTLQLQLPGVALSSGAACASSQPEPSHVLRAIGRSEDEVRSSLRFGLGRFNTMDEVQFVVDHLPRCVKELKQLL